MLSLFNQNQWLLLIIIGVGGLLFGIGAVIIITNLIKKIPQTIDQQVERQPQEIASHPKKQTSQLHEVYKLLPDLTATLNYQRVLDSALDLSNQSLSSPMDPTDKLISAVMLFADNGDQKPYLYIAASRGFPHSDLKDTFPALMGLLKDTIDEGASITTNNITQDEELGSIFALQLCDSAYCYPLRRGLDTYGVLLHCHPEKNYFTEGKCEILDIIGKQAMVAIQNALLYRELEEEKERMVEIQERARKKLARDLHDGPTQSVAAIAMQANLARRLLETDQEAASKELYKIEDLARRTTTEIRHMLFTLRPLILESQGLSAAFKSMADKMSETFNQNVILDIDENVESELGLGKQGVIFAIVEEAVNNARKYAQAQNIWVRLKRIQENIAALEVQDDGSGFDVNAIDASYETRGSLGLLNMRERTELVNGIFQINSAPGRGTHIQVIVPLTEDAVDILHRSG